MPPARRHILWQPLRRKLCACVTLVAYLATSLGVPLPAAARGPGDHPCSCPTTSLCSDGSCCCTRGQPPPPADDEGPARGGRERKAHPACCAPGQEESPRPCCAAPKAGGCCSTTPDESKHGTPPPQTPPKPTRPAPDQPTVQGAQPQGAGGVRWVPGVAALRCHGLSTLWATTGAALPPAPPVTWKPFFPAVGWLPGLGGLSLTQFSPPPDPPPRAAGV